MQNYCSVCAPEMLVTSKEDEKLTELRVCETCCDKLKQKNSTHTIKPLEVGRNKTTILSNACCCSTHHMQRSSKFNDQKCNFTPSFPKKLFKNHSYHPLNHKKLTLPKSVFDVETNHVNFISNAKIFTLAIIKLKVHRFFLFCRFL